MVFGNWAVQRQSGLAEVMRVRPLGRDGVCVCLVTLFCPTVCNLMDCSPPGSSVHGITSAKILGSLYFCVILIESHLQRPYFQIRFSSVQLLSHIWLFATPWTAACQTSLSITNSRNLPKLMSIELVMPYNHLILCHPLFLLPSIFPSIRKVPSIK